jgi:hypothetical protein
VRAASVERHDDEHVVRTLTKVLDDATASHRKLDAAEGPPGRAARRRRPPVHRPRRRQTRRPRAREHPQVHRGELSPLTLRLTVRGQGDGLPDRLLHWLEPELADGQTMLGIGQLRVQEDRGMVPYWSSRTEAMKSWYSAALNRGTNLAS